MNEKEESVLVEEIEPSKDINKPQEEFKTKFNWGAFNNTLMFGFANHANLCYLVLIPVFNIFWIFWAGFHAEKWCLEENDYQNEEEFRKIMKSWNRGGFLMFLVNLAMSLFYAWMFLMPIFSAINKL